MVLDPWNPAVEAWNSHQHWSMRRPPALQHQTLGLTNLSQDLGQGHSDHSGFPMGPWGHGAMMVFPTARPHLGCSTPPAPPSSHRSSSSFLGHWPGYWLGLRFGQDSKHPFLSMSQLFASNIFKSSDFLQNPKLSKLSSYWGTPHLLQPGWEESRLHFRMHAQPGLEGKTSMLGGDDFWYGGFHKWR